MLWVFQGRTLFQYDMYYLDSIEQIDGQGQPQIEKQSMFLYDFRVNHRDRLCLATVVAEVV